MLDVSWVGVLFAGNVIDEKVGKRERQYWKNVVILF